MYVHVQSCTCMFRPHVCTYTVSVKSCTTYTLSHYITMQTSTTGVNSVRLHVTANICLHHRVKLEKPKPKIHRIKCRLLIIGLRNCVSPLFRSSLWKEQRDSATTDGMECYSKADCYHTECMCTSCTSRTINVVHYYRTTGLIHDAPPVGHTHGIHDRLFVYSKP